MSEKKGTGYNISIQFLLKKFWKDWERYLFFKKKITTKENSEIELRTEIEFKAECKYQEDFIVALG